MAAGLACLGLAQVVLVALFNQRKVDYLAAEVQAALLPQQARLISKVFLLALVAEVFMQKARFQAAPDVCAS